MISSVKKWFIDHHLVLIFIFIYFLLSVIKIEHPGVNNDQLMFVNAATLNPDNTFLWKDWHGIPVMVFQYIGALKSYLYMPIFYLFGVNIWSIRVPQIILICVNWFVFYKALIYFFDKKISILTILLLCLDPSIIVYSKIDQGPTVLEFFLKILAVYFLSLYLSKGQIKYILLIFVVLPLGVFNKLNFMWFVNAFLISLFIFYYKKFGRLNILLTFVSYLFLIKLFLKLSREVALSYKGFSAGVSLSNLSSNLVHFYSNLIGIISGNILFKTVYGETPTKFGNLAAGIILSIWLVGFFSIIRRSNFKKGYLFFLSIVILTLLQLLLTKNAVAPWHVLSIYPFFTTLFAVSIWEIYNQIKTRRFKNLFTFLIGGIIFYEIVINIIYINKYSKPVNAVAYSGEIYHLINFARNSNKKFICLDVDICNQLLSFTQQTGKYKEPFHFLDPQTYNYTFIKLSDNFKEPTRYLYIDHGDKTSHFPEFRRSFFKYLVDNNINFKKIKEFKDGENIAFEVYQVGYF